MKRLLPLAALLLAIPTMTSCTPHTTEATEVGVRFNKITKTMELAQPGATYFFVRLRLRLSGKNQIRVKAEVLGVRMNPHIHVTYSFHPS